MSKGFNGRMPGGMGGMNMNQLFPYLILLISLLCKVIKILL